ncbi:MAG TPA: hypothetical protein VFH61_03695 [Thermoleophilia bacterium]|nr:hypothetical protein [Thermoleophilia bacterium]
MREHRFIVFRQPTDARGRVTAIPGVNECLGSVLLPYTAKTGGWMVLRDAIGKLWGPGSYVVTPDPRAKADELWPGWQHHPRAGAPTLPIEVPPAPKPLKTAVSAPDA